MAHIIYDGVPSVEGGTIFKGIKFWVAQRTPTRCFLLQQIENNGGQVVPLEKQADILIADDKRWRQAPVGSCSYTFITDSVNNGIIQLKDRYMIGPDPELARPVGGRGLAKSSRTPFSGADDAALAKWVLAHTTDRKGNKIYQELERINGRHTWQSWRDRWTKTLQDLPPTKLEELAAKAPVELDNPAVKPSPGARVESRPEPRPASATAPRNQSRAQSRSASKETSRSGPRPASRVSSRPESDHARTIAGMAQSSDAGSRHDEEFTEDMEEQQSEKEESQHSSHVSEVEEGSDSDDDDIYEDLQVYIDAHELNINIEDEIGGKVIKPPRLGEAVVAHGIDPEEVDWTKVADDLGLDSSPQVLQKLKQLGSILLDFQDAMISYQNSPKEAQRGESAKSHEAVKSPPGYVRSSPPRGLASGKRRLSSSGPISKRMKFNRDAEIPSTPDEKIGVVKRDASPSARRNDRRQGYVGNGGTSQQLPARSGLRPEGQAGPGLRRPSAAQQEAPRLPTEETSLDITPSQQLHVESFDPSPIPLTFDKGRDEIISVPSIRSLRKSEAGKAPPDEEPVAIQVGPKQRRRPPLSYSHPRPLRLIPGATPLQQAARQAKQGAASQDRSNRKEIEETIEHYESLGYPRHIVIEGLKRTTMTPGGLAALVMESLRNGDEVPSHHEGIWTDRDDKELELVDSVDPSMDPMNVDEVRHKKKAKKASDRLIKKHGLERIELRRAFLDAEAKESGEAFAR